MRTGPSLVLPALTSCLLACIFSCGAGERPDAPPGSVEIRAAELRAHVEFLASDELEGREAGEAGVTRAEEYIATALGSYGLEPLPGREELFVPFTVYRPGWDLERTALYVVSAEETLQGVAGVDFRPFAFSDSGEVEADVVFAGYGITAPEHLYDDYDGLDVEGKLVLILRHEPRESDATSSFAGVDNTRHAVFETKAENARRHGAAGLLLVTDPLHHPDRDDLRVRTRLALAPPALLAPLAPEDAPVRTDFPAVHVSQRLARRMVEATGASLAELQRQLDSGTRPAAMPPTKVKARLTVERQRRPQAVAARNVVAFLEGSDPARKDQWIVVGAHHDHIGSFAGDGDTVFNGADDNASGTAGLLELAQAFATAASRPARSLVFATFSAEESGLLGSRSLIRNEELPLDRVGLMLNLDMIGRNPGRPLRVFGDGFAQGLGEIVQGAAETLSLPLELAGTDYASNSDHDPFFRRGIPILFFFTGVHQDYHGLADHADKLDYRRMESVVKLAHATLRHLAEAPALPSFLHQVAWLGLSIEVETDADRAVPVIRDVKEPSRAREAGFRRGDRLVKLDGELIHNPSLIGERFRFVPPGTTVSVTVEREDEVVQLDVKRPLPGFLGVVPQELAAPQRSALGLRRPVGFLVAELVDGGPAIAAGIQEGDVITHLDGETVGMRNLRARLAELQAGKTVEVDLVRGSERKTVSLVLGRRQ